MEKDQCKLYHFKLYHSDRYLNNNPNILKTKGTQAGIVSKHLKHFQSIYLFSRLVLWANIDITTCPQEVQKPSSFEQYNIPETLSTKSYFKKQRQLSALPHIVDFLLLTLHVMRFLKS